jgi:hypothetical protein
MQTQFYVQKRSLFSNYGDTNLAIHVLVLAGGQVTLCAKNDR